MPRSAFPKPMAAVDAINRFEGPANGIKLNPKPVRKIIMNSIIDAIYRCPLSSSQKLVPPKLISASYKAPKFS